MFFLPYYCSYIITPIIKARPYLPYQDNPNEKRWYVLNEQEFLDYAYSCEIDDKFKEYIEPKKKVTKYLWYNTKENSLLRYFATNKENLFYQIQCGSPNAFLNHESYYIRLDWSATEFDDE